MPAGFGLRPERACRETFKFNLDKSMRQQRRLAGFDVARSLAIFGMIIVHFTLVMTDGTPPEKWSEILLQILDGRPAATFVILAGIGATLMAKKAADSGAAGARATVETVLRRRGLLLLAFGFLNLAIWQGDILRIYGVSLLVVPWLVWRGARALLLTGLAFVLGFCLLLALVDYDRNWDWNTMTYHRLWTPSGLSRSLFYDGFRSVFPWTGLLILGIWLGRLDWSASDTPRKVITWGLAMVMASSAVSFGILNWLGAHPQPGLDRATANALFGLQSMPPLPIFLLNAVGCALLAIGASVAVERRWKDVWPVSALAATGRMAFTWYMAHIVLGLGGVIVLGWTKTSPWRALGAATGFFAIAVAVSVWWRRHFSSGPLEYMLRSVGQISNQRAPTKENLSPPS
jgi:uncharacterized membrane protein YeiB